MVAKKKTRKIPTTKAGKPDKRYVKTDGAASKATGKKPTKRLQKRRAKPQVKGYSANPSKSVFLVVVKHPRTEKVLGYLSKFDAKNRAVWDDEITKADVYATKEAAKKALLRSKESTNLAYKFGYAELKVGK